MLGIGLFYQPCNHVFGRDEGAKVVIKTILKVFTKSSGKP